MIRPGNTFAALKYPNFRLWFAGQLVSLVGTWMQSTAQGYLVYQLTQSPAFLGYVGFAGGAPTWLFTLYGGVIADRMPRRTLLVITQTSMMLLAFTLAGLVFTGLVRPWHIVLLSTLLGIANAFDAPARQSFVVEMVDRSAMTNAIALNATMFNLGTIVGPAIAGVTYAALGPAWCFSINGLSFIAVIAALGLMKLDSQVVQRASASAVEQIRESFRYIRSQAVLQVLLVNVGVINLFAMSLMTLVPAWAVEVLGGDVTTNGLLLSARGVGALAGALLLASLGQMQIRGRLISWSGLLVPLVLFLFAFTHWLPASLVCIALIGAGMMIATNATNALLQNRVPDEMRGRVMSFFSLIFIGSMPIGSLMAGSFAAAFSEAGWVILCAAALLAFSLYIWLRHPSLRSLP